MLKKSQSLASDSRNATSIVRNIHLYEHSEFKIFKTQIF